MWFSLVFHSWLLFKKVLGLKTTVDRFRSYYHHKDNISYFPLNPVSDYVYIAELNTRIRVGWKTLPNLNFKLKFQTQTWISKLKSFPSSRVIRDSGKLAPRLKGMKPYCHVAAQSIWAVDCYLLPWRPFYRSNER